MITTTVNESLINRLQTNPTIEDIVTFAVRNNFPGIKQQFLKLGYGRGSFSNAIVSEEDAINLLLNFYKSGYSIRDFLNVRYVPGSPNETGQNYLNGSGGAKIDWANVAGVAGSILTILGGIVGGFGLEPITNNEQLPPPPPPAPKSFKDENPAMFWGLIALCVGGLLGGIFGVVKKNKIALFTGFPLALIAGGALIYLTTKED